MAGSRGDRFTKKLRWIFLRVVLLLVLALFGLEYLGCRQQDVKNVGDKHFNLFASAQSAPLITLENLPEYEGRSFIVLHRNEPQFSAEFKARRNPFIPLRRWIRWGAAAPLMACWGRSFFPRSQGGPSV